MSYQILTMQASYSVSITVNSKNYLSIESPYDYTIRAYIRVDYIYFHLIIFCCLSAVT